jgi:hypothetical protein
VVAQAIQNLELQGDLKDLARSRGETLFAASASATAKAELLEPRLERSGSAGRNAAATDGIRKLPISNAMSGDEEIQSYGTFMGAILCRLSNAAALAVWWNPPLIVASFMRGPSGRRQNECADS